MDVFVSAEMHNTFSLTPHCWHRKSQFISQLSFGNVTNN